MNTFFSLFPVLTIIVLNQRPQNLPMVIGHDSPTLKVLCPLKSPTVLKSARQLQHLHWYLLGMPGFVSFTHKKALLPLVVSLSRTKNVPRLFPGISSSLSASLRPTFPKYHLSREGHPHKDLPKRSDPARLTRTWRPYSSAWMESAGAT